jgi:glycosyltransferase involved in cell wall biosynthesis
MQPAPRAQICAAGDQARVMLSVSAALARDMAAIGLAADRITVHYTGLDHARFFPRPRDQARAELMQRVPSLALPQHGRIVSSVGALIAIKGQALAIEALTQLPDDVTLVLAGTGPDADHLRAQAARLGLADRVILAGALGHDDLPLLLAASSAMVLASLREGIANAWIEALASGTPIVIPDVGGAREVIDSGVAGRLVERDPEAIAAGLNDVLAECADPAAVARSAERFSWDGNAARLAEIYRAAIT